jgi:hypothetical protein
MVTGSKCVEEMTTLHRRHFHPKPLLAGVEGEQLRMDSRALRALEGLEDT